MYTTLASYDSDHLIQWTGKPTGTQETHLGVSWREKYEIEGINQSGKSIGSFEFYSTNTSSGDSIMIVPPGGMHIKKGVGGFNSAQGLLEQVSQDTKSILGLFLPFTGPHRSARTDIETRGYIFSGKGKLIDNKGIALFIHRSTISKLTNAVLDVLGYEKPNSTSKK